MLRSFVALRVVTEVPDRCGVEVVRVHLRRVGTHVLEYGTHVLEYGTQVLPIGMRFTQLNITCDSARYACDGFRQSILDGAYTCCVRRPVFRSRETRTLCGIEHVDCRMGSTWAGAAHNYFGYNTP